MDAAPQPHATRRSAHSLRFADPEIERGYLLERALEMTPFLRAGMFTSFPIWVVAGFVLPALSPDHRVATLIFTWGVCAPGSVLCALLTYPRSLTRHRPLMANLVNLFLGLAISLFTLLVLERPGLAAGGVVVMIFYAFTVFRLTPLSALLSTLPYVATTQVLLITHGQSDRADVVSLSFLLWLSEVAGLMGASVADRVSRESYARRLTIEAQQRELAVERERSERLLLNVLPKAVADRLKRDDSTIADRAEAVTILFCDVVGFTQLSSAMAPEELVQVLNRLFSSFDEIAAAHGIEKIKTIGDAYMTAAGVPTASLTHAEDTMAVAIAMRDAVQTLNRELGTQLAVRIGVNTGPAVAGVIGRRKFSYDLWGDAVNTAARMESHGLPGEIQVSESTFNCLSSRYRFEDRGPIEIKGKGAMRAYLLRS